MIRAGALMLAFAGARVGGRQVPAYHALRASAFELAPDWACEVLSPSPAPIDRTHKLPIYAREKVGHVWLVDHTEHPGGDPVHSAVFTRRPH